MLKKVGPPHMLISRFYPTGKSYKQNIVVFQSGDAKEIFGASTSRSDAPVRRLSRISIQK